MQYRDFVQLGFIGIFMIYQKFTSDFRCEKPQTVIL